MRKRQLRPTPTSMLTRYRGGYTQVVQRRSDSNADAYADAVGGNRALPIVCISLRLKSYSVQHLRSVGDKVHVLHQSQTVIFVESLKKHQRMSQTCTQCYCDVSCCGSRARCYNDQQTSDDCDRIVVVRSATDRTVSSSLRLVSYSLQGA